MRFRQGRPTIALVVGALLAGVILAGCTLRFSTAGGGQPSATPTARTPSPGSPTMTPEEDAVVAGVHKIQVGVTSWAVDHDMVLPDPSLVAAGSEFAAKYVDPWPTDLYTGKPMRQGTGPGDFAYSFNGPYFELRGYAAGGRTLIIVP